MKTSVTLVISILAILAAFIIVKDRSESFDAVGMVFNNPPEWFRKDMYNPSEWVVAYNPDQLSQPECLSYYRGDPTELNWLSSTNRFWRM